MILTPLQNLPKNVEDLSKLIVAKGFKKLPKVQKIAKSGHTGSIPQIFIIIPNRIISPGWLSASMIIILI